jgi:hypothetical protein
MVLSESSESKGFMIDDSAVGLAHDYASRSHFGGEPSPATKERESNGPERK